MTLKILIVDDIPDIQEVISFYVETATKNPIILLANSGESANEMINRHPDIDLVICDYNMPKGNGGKVYKYFREKSDKMFILHTSDGLESHPEFQNIKNFNCCKTNGIGIIG